MKGFLRPHWKCASGVWHVRNGLRCPVGVPTKMFPSVILLQVKFETVCSLSLRAACARVSVLVISYHLHTTACNDDQRKHLHWLYICIVSITDHRIHLNYPVQIVVPWLQDLDLFCERWLGYQSLEQVCVVHRSPHDRDLMHYMLLEMLVTCRWVNQKSQVGPWTNPLFGWLSLYNSLKQLC